MVDAFMPDAVLSQADLRGAMMMNASLYGSGARVDDALFGGAYLVRAIVSGIDFSRVQAPGAVFTNAVLVNTSFAGANLIGANFEQTYLQGASFVGSEVDRADFTNAVLSDSPCSTATPLPSGATACWTYANAAGYSYAVQFGATAVGSIATDIYGLVCPTGCITCAPGQCPDNGGCDGSCGSQYLQPYTPPSPAIPVCTPFESNWCPPIGAGPFGRDASQRLRRSARETMTYVSSASCSAERGGVGR